MDKETKKEFESLARMVKYVKAQEDFREEFKIMKYKMTPVEYRDHLLALTA